MGGLTDSEVILAALNQSVQAINDLIAAVEALVLQVDVQSASPDVNVSCTPQVVVNVSCGGQTGSTPDSASGDEGQTPPTGYVEPDPETTDRKCRVANMIHDSMGELVTELAVLDVDQYAAVGFVVTLGIVGGILGSAIPVAGTVVGAVAGVASAIALQLVTGGVALDLTDLGTILSTNQESLVQSLYNATTAQGARDAYTAILTAEGATAIESGLIALALPNDLMNLLFFTREDLETQIAAYEGIIDCSQALLEEWHFDDGAEGWVHEVETGAEWQDMAAWSTGTPGPDGLDSSEGFLRQACTKSANSPAYSANWHRNIEEMAVTANTGDQFRIDTWYSNSDHAGFFVRIRYTDDTEDSEYYPNPTASTWAQMVCTVTVGNNGKTVKEIEINGHAGDATGTWVFGFDRALWVPA